MSKSSVSQNIVFVVLFFCFLVIFTIIKFPRNSLEKRIITEIEQNAPFSIFIEDLEFNFPSSFKFKDVTLVTKGDSRIELKKVDIKASLLSLLTTGQLKIPFDAEVFDGEVDGTIYYLREERRIGKVVANIDSIDSKSLPKLISKNSNIGLDGRLSGNMNIMIPLVNGKKMPSGSYFINSDSLTIKNFEINKIKFDDEYKDLKAELSGSISGLTTNIDRLSFVNNDIDLRFQGEMPTPWKIRQRSKIDLIMNLNIKSPKAKLALLKAFLSPQRDGSLRGRIFGPASSPKLVNSNKKINDSGI
ncbi:MAG: type II secretion system protein GspN [Candidatus Dadabacteria bacterium]|nr:type II secretion system protein GspN [Candidatus Dadabacteria bacterium]NIQ14193.1 type II secretion system protein GspN [Candidatus Dadabacteria bacterium]